MKYDFQTTFLSVTLSDSTKWQMLATSLSASMLRKQYASSSQTKKFISHNWSFVSLHLNNTTYRNNLLTTQATQGNHVIHKEKLDIITNGDRGTKWPNRHESQGKQFTLKRIIISKVTEVEHHSGSRTEPAQVVTAALHLSIQEMVSSRISITPSTLEMAPFN